MPPDQTVAQDPARKAPWGWRRAFVVMGLLLCTAGGLWLGAHQHATREAQRWAFWQGALLQPLDGGAFRPSEWGDRPIVVNFWATWCAPCREEMPELDALARQNPQWQVVGVALDREQAVRDYLRARPVGYAIVLGSDPVNFDWLSQRGNPLRSLPFTVVLDSAGRVRYQHLGQVKMDTLQQALKDLR